MASTDKVGTLSSLAKATTFGFVFSFSLGSLSGLIAPILGVWLVVLLMLAYLALEFVGLHFKIRRLILLAIVMWSFHFVLSWLAILIPVTKQPLKG